MARKICFRREKILGSCQQPPAQQMALQSLPCPDHCAGETEASLQALEQTGDRWDGGEGINPVSQEVWETQRVIPRGQETSRLREQLTSSSEVLRTSRVRDWIRE